MTLGHEKLDVCRLSIEYVAWVFAKVEKPGGIHRPARDQWLRAGQSIPLDVAEEVEPYGEQKSDLDFDLDLDFDFDGAEARQ